MPKILQKEEFIDRRMSVKDLSIASRAWSLTRDAYIDCLGA
jgi:hypothetical protein